MKLRTIIVENVETLPISDLLMTKEEISQAVSNLSRGLPSMTPGPLLVNYHDSVGRYQLTNGYHRVIEALMRGERVVPVKNGGPAEWRLPSAKELFIPDPDAEYFGMEEFIENYELRRL